MEKLYNCPNCGGFLDDTGRCEFCGSKVYDFVNANFDKHSKTYIRIKCQGKVIIMPVVFTSYSYNFFDRGEMYGTLDYHVVGTVIQEEE